MKRLLLLLLLTTPALAQTVQISGTVVDPNGCPYVNGTGRALLVPSSTQYYFGNNPVTNVRIVIQLDSTGHFSMPLYNTSLLTPTSPQAQWQFQFSSAQVVSPVNYGTINFTMSPMTLTSDQDISSTIQAQAVAIPGGCAPASGQVGNPNCAGSPIAYYPNGLIASITGDCYTSLDGLGHGTMKGLGLTDITSAGFYYLTQGQPPGPAPPGSILTYGPASISPYSEVPPGTSGSVGQTRVINSVGTDANGHPVLAETWGTAGGAVSITGTSPIVVTPSPITGTGVVSCPTCSTSVGSVEIQTNGTDNANCTGGVCPLLNNATGSTSVGGVTVTPVNSSGGTVVYNASDSDTRALNPSAPVITVGGTPGTSTVCYVVLGWEDGTNYTFHSGVSAQGCTSTANSTLSLSPLTLKGYADTLYGYRCFDIYRVSGGPSQGKLASCAGKTYTDTATAGDGTTASATNNTVLRPSFDPTHNCNTVPDAPRGVDGPPCSPTQYDSELNEVSGAPGDSNNTGWTWGGGGTSACTQGSASAAWSGGMLVLTTDATTQLNCLVRNITLPAAPYVFRVWVDNLTTSGSTAGQVCAIGLRESSSGKMATVSINYANAPSVVTANGGYVWELDTWTTNVTHSHITPWQSFNASSGYMEIQNDGSGNVKAYFSDTGDGVAFPLFSTTTIASAFTTGPDQILIGGAGISGKAATCAFDFFRERTAP